MIIFKRDAAGLTGLEEHKFASLPIEGRLRFRYKSIKFPRRFEFKTKSACEGIENIMTYTAPR
jgi:hypothetical protein